MTDENFRLISYLFADVRRQYLLLHGEDASLSLLNLWVGMLSPRFLPVLLCRVAHFFYLLKLRPLAKIVSWINFFLFGIEIATQCVIGKGLFLPHTQGTVIGAWCIGENATIFQGVTLGAKVLDMTFQSNLRPFIGDNVLISAGAKVIGGILVGEGAVIGANAVVISDVPAGAVAVGVPARYFYPDSEKIDGN